MTNETAELAREVIAKFHPEAASQIMDALKESGIVLVSQQTADRAEWARYVIDWLGTVTVQTDDARRLAERTQTILKGESAVCGQINTGN